MASRSRSPVTAGRRTGRGRIVLPLVLVLAVAVADMVAPHRVHLGPLLVVAPAVAAAYAGVRVTVLVGGLSIAALAGIGTYRAKLLNENVIVQLCALTALTVFLVVFCALRERHERELDRARDIAEATQRVLLRPLPGRSGPLSIASHYRAAEADTRIGGDLFAAARTASGTRLIIGDVSGRGLASISDTAALLGAFRAAAHREASLPDLVRYLEGSVRWSLEEDAAPGDVASVDGYPDGTAPWEAQDGSGPRHPAERFVTAAVLDIPDGEPVLRMVNCGHPPPLLLRDRTAEPLVTADPAPPLGLGGLLGTRYETTTHPFAPGDVLLLYTDGLSEARDGTGAFYPLRDRAAQGNGRGTDGLLRWLAEDLGAHTARPLNDDLAMVAVRRDLP